MSDTLKNKIEIVVFKTETNCPVLVFNSIKAAATYYNVDRETIIRRIQTGERIADGTWLDWGMNSNDEIISKIEASYKARFISSKTRSADYWLRRKYVASQEV